MRRNISLLILIVIMFTTNLVCAENHSWSDENYNYKNIKTVLVTNSVSEGKPAVNYDSAENIVDRDVMHKLRERYPKITFITYQQLVDSIQKSMPDTDLNKLKNDDAAAYQKLIEDNQAKFCDAIMQISIASMGYTHSQMSIGRMMQNNSEEVWSKSSSHSTSNSTYNSDGSITTKTTTTTTSVSVNAPSTDQIISSIVGTDFTNMGLRMRLLSAANNKPIWTYTDIRSRGNPMLVKVTAPEDILDRILNEGCSSLGKVLGR